MSDYSQFRVRRVVTEGFGKRVMIDLQLGYLENKICSKLTAFTMYYRGYMDVKCIPKTPCMKEGLSVCTHNCTKPFKACVVYIYCILNQYSKLPDHSGRL